MSERLTATEIKKRIDELYRRSKRNLVDYIIVLELNLRNMGEIIDGLSKIMDKEIFEDCEKETK